jgi:hypothetical protein
VQLEVVRASVRNLVKSTALYATAGTSFDIFAPPSEGL